MKINAIDLRVGHVFEMDNRLLQVLKRDVTKPGKGGAYLQAEVRDIRSGNKDNLRLRTQETVERARLDQETYQFLFADGDMYTFMNQNNYEQIELQGELIGDPKQFLSDGMVVEIESYEGEPLFVKLPENATFEILEADPVVKGQTASSSYKPAVIAGDIRVMVPPHIEAGTRIVIKTEDGSYVEKAKD